MNYSNYINGDLINGEGFRCTLFVSGCTHKCKGCFNAKAWDFNYGKEFTKDIENKIIDDLNKLPKKGQLTLLGGEPFQNINGLLSLVERTNKIENHNIWCYTGYTYEEILCDPEKLNFFSLMDVVIVGRFILEQKDYRLKFRGSSNQMVLDVKKTLKEKKPILYLE